MCVDTRPARDVWKVCCGISKDVSFLPALSSPRGDCLQKAAVEGERTSAWYHFPSLLIPGSVVTAESYSRPKSCLEFLTSCKKTCNNMKMFGCVWGGPWTCWLKDVILLPVLAGWTLVLYQCVPIFTSKGEPRGTSRAGGAHVSTSRCSKPTSKWHKPSWEGNSYTCPGALSVQIHLWKSVLSLYLKNFAAGS